MERERTARAVAAIAGATGVRPDPSPAPSFCRLPLSHHRIRLAMQRKQYRSRPAPEALHLDDLILETHGLTKEFRGFTAQELYRGLQLAGVPEQ
jgi:hypothetical protein